MEEIEHKSVAIDLYTATGGGYFVRIAAMLMASITFVWMTTYFSWQDRTLVSLSARKERFSFTFLKSGIFGDMFGIYLKYYSPWFHPSDRDDSSLVRASHETDVQYPVKSSG